MPFTVAAARAADEPGIVSQLQELSPSPQSKVFAVALFALFEFFRWLPIVVLVEQFFIRDVFAAAQELPDLLNGLAFHAEWLAHIATHRKCGMGSFAAKERLRYLSSSRVVGFWDDFCDHGSRILSRTAKEATTEDTEDTETEN